jgi:hypothetical protein
MTKRIAETTEHKRLKALMYQKLTTWLVGSTKKEYLSSGHKLDVFYVSYQGISIMVEIIWTPTKENFQRDLILLLNSDAKVKIVLTNPKILQREDLVLQFEKSRISELQKGYLVSPMFDGGKILDYASTYIDTYVKELVLTLIDQLRIDSQAIQMHFTELKESVIYPLLNALKEPGYIPSLDKIEELLKIDIDLLDDFFEHHYKSIQEKYIEIVQLQKSLDLKHSNICDSIDTLIISKLDSYKIKHAPNDIECRSSDCIPIDKFRERTINCVINNSNINKEIIPDTDFFNIMFRSKTASIIFRASNDTNYTMILQQLRSTARTVIEDNKIVGDINKHTKLKDHYLQERRKLYRSINMISHKIILSRPNCSILGP